MNTPTSRIAVLAASAIGWLLAGCTAPNATLDLMTVARKGLLMARQAEVDQQAELTRHMEAQRASLDTAFDADVRLVAAGQIKDPDGKPLALTPEWVISARKGYAVARDVLAQQSLSAQAAHATRLDNIDAADEALDMASRLVVQQWNLDNTVRETLMNFQRRLIHGQ